MGGNLDINCKSNSSMDAFNNAIVSGSNVKEERSLSLEKGAVCYICIALYLISNHLKQSADIV